MKKKILMLLMCFALSASMLAGCANNTAPEDSRTTVEDEDDEEDEEEDETDTEDADEQDDAEAEPEAEPASEEEPAEAMPRSDAYEMFLAGEMDVTLINDEDDEYTSPDPGTYSYEELRDAVTSELGYYIGGDFDIKYALFTPDSGQEGDDVLVMYVESEEGAAGNNWIGFIAYNNGKLELKYFAGFGYRSYLDLYYSGDILYGGSGGAGAHYQDYIVINPDSSADVVYESAYLYASWCNDVFYELDPEYDYLLIPELDPSSELEMTRVTKDGKVYICVSSWSGNKAIKEQEEAYVQTLEDLGAIVVDEAEMERLTANNIDESKTMTWNDIETVTVEPSEDF